MGNSAMCGDVQLRALALADGQRRAEAHCRNPISLNP